jgi:hypothetical protein
VPLESDMTTFFDVLWGGDEGTVVATYALHGERSRGYRWPFDAEGLRRDVSVVAGAGGAVWVSVNLFKPWVAQQGRAQLVLGDVGAGDLLPRARTMLLEIQNNGVSEGGREALAAVGGMLLAAPGSEHALAMLALDTPRPHSLLVGWSGQVVRAVGAKRWRSLFESVPVPGTWQPDGLVRLESRAPGRRVATSDLDALRLTAVERPW